MNTNLGQITVYPNPFNHQLQIDSKHLPDEISIMNLMGQNILQSNNLDEINKQLPYLKEGAFILRLSIKNQYHFFKIIKSDP